MNIGRIFAASALAAAMLLTSTGAHAAPTGSKKAPAKKAAAPKPAAAQEGCPSAMNYNAKDKADIIKLVKDKYVCLSNNMYLSESEELGAVCPDGAKVLELLDRMLCGGWPKEDILALVNNMKMGRPLVQQNGQKACALPNGKLKLDFFIMSYCPYGVRYVTDALTPMLDELGGDIEYTPYYIVGKNPGTGELNALHGQKELDENLRQVCIREKLGIGAWKNYFDCFAKEVYGNREAPKDWTYCADQAKINVKDVQACFDTEAKSMIEKDIQLSQAAGAQASPTAVYNCGSNIVWRTCTMSSRASNKAYRITS